MIGRTTMPFAAVLVLLPFACSAFAATPDLAQTIRDAKVREAAFRTIEASIRTLAQEGASADDLATRMLEDPRTYALPEVARTKVAEAEKGALRRAFREQLEVFARSRAATLPTTWVDDVVREEETRVEATIDRLLQESLPERFQAARRAATDAQREKIEPLQYPPATEIAALAANSTSTAMLLGERIAETTRAPQATALAKATAGEIRAANPLFSEIDAALDEQVGAAIAAGIGELWRQEGILQRFDPQGRVRQVDIAAALQGELEAAARISGLPYGVFPQVAEAIAARATAIERRSIGAAFARGLAPKEGCPDLPAEVLREATSVPLQRLPSTFAEHAEALTASLRPKTVARILEKHAALVEESERAAFLTHLNAVIAEDEKLAQRVAAALAACIEPPLREYRATTAAAELLALQPAIADLSFELAGDDLIGVALGDGEVDASLFPNVDAARLEETRELHAAHVAELHGEAVAAVRAQELLTRVDERRKRFVMAVESDPNRTLARKQHYQDEYEADVLEAWKRNRGRVLLRDARGAVRHPEKYGFIFPTTAEIIGEIITLEFERPVPEATPVPTPPPTVPPPPSPLPTQPPSTPPPTPMPQSSGPLETQERAGLPQPMEPPVPMPESGGAPADGPAEAAGGGNSCEDVLGRCLLAVNVCYEAVTQCRDDPNRCPESVARCGQAKFACEQTQ